MSGPELRVRSLQDFTDDLAELAASDRDDRRAIIADVAPTMDVESLRERLDFEDAFIVATETPSATVESVEDGHCARYADFQYPDFAFADELTETNPLEGADAQFAGTVLFPTERLDDRHHRVLDTDTLHEQFKAAVEQYEHPEQYAAMTGYFNPEGGSWSILSEGAHYRIQSLAFPKAVSPDGDATLLGEAGMAFSGLVILPRDVLSETVLELIDGDKTEVTA